MTSCQSVKTEKVYIVPDVDFPVFPSLEREIHEDGSWTIPKESIDQLAEYYIKIQETETNYKELKELYEKEKEK
jgi:hypothetical protein